MPEVIPFNCPLLNNNATVARQSVMVVSSVIRTVLCTSLALEEGEHICHAGLNKHPCHYSES